MAKITIDTDLAAGEYDLTPVAPPPPPPPPVNDPYLSVRQTVGGQPELLEGQILAGEVFVELDPNGQDSEITQVRFYLDGNLQQTENNPPYDYKGGAAPNPNPWDTSELPDGNYTISAEVDMTGGLFVTAATFGVDNEVVVNPPPPPPPPPPVGTDVTLQHEGFSFELSGAGANGVYLDGSPWVVGPVELVSHTGTGGEVNPVYGPSFGFDSRKWYDPAKHFTSGTLNPNESLFIVQARNGTPNGTTGVPRPYLSRGAILTVVDQAPLADSFRPTYAGVQKRTYTLPSDFDARIAALPKFNYPADNVAGKTAKYRHVAGPSLRAGWEQRYFQFGDWHEDYSRDLASDFNAAASHLLIDISDIEKRDLAIALIQHGIDYHGCWESAIQEGYADQVSLGRQMFAHGGGIGSGRKLPIILAGHLLGAPGLRDFYKDETHSNKDRWFLEDCQTWVNDGTTGDQAWYSSNGMPSGAVAWREGYRSVHTPGNTSYRKCCTANAWAPGALVMLALDLEAFWAHPEWFSYVDWYVDTDQSAATWERIYDDWARGLWDQERAGL